MPSHSAHRASLALLALLAANPVVLLLLVGSGWIAFGLWGAVTLALQLVYHRFGTGLPTVYVVNIAAVLGVISYGELLVRFRYADYVMEDLYHLRSGYYFNRPRLISRLVDREFAVDYLTNLQGFRIGYSQDAEAGYEHVDWLFIGDSYTQGAQVQFEDLYTTLLYRRFPNMIVANAGISGWGIPEEYEYFRNEGYKLRPKLVVLQVSSFNDFMKVERRRAGVSDYLMERSHAVRLLLQNVKFVNPARLPLGRWAEPFYPDESSNRRFNIFYRESSPEKDRDLAEYARYLRLFAEAVRASGAELIVVLLPTKEQIRFDDLEEVVSAFAIDPRQLDMSRPNEFMRSLTDSLGIPFIDAIEEFASARSHPYFSFDEHLTAFGHALLAEVLSLRLASHVPGNVPQMLSQTYAGDRYPTYSPDGASIIYQAPAYGRMKLFVADTQFRQVQQLTFGDENEGHALIPYPGDRLVFTEGDPRQGKTRVVMSRLDGRQRLVLNAPGYPFGAIPSYSLDGQRLAYAGWGLDQRGRLTTPQVIVCYLSCDSVSVVAMPAESWRPVFSPDGQKLAFISKVGEQFDVFLHDLASGETSRLTDTPYDEWDPQFSHDGRKLVFAARRQGNWDLFVLDLTTGGTVQLTTTRGDEWDPVFAPDDGAVTFAGEFGIFRGIYKLEF